MYSANSRIQTKSIVKNKFTSILHIQTHTHAHLYLLNAFNFILNLKRKTS